MGQTRGQIKTTVRNNLDDSGVSFYSDDDLNDSLQDAYDDIACLSQCIVKTIVLQWIGDLSYYNFVEDFGITDYMATTAIFNYTTNVWLRDDLNLRDFDKIRRDWETWTGSPQFWAPSDPLHIAIAPRETTGGVSVGGAFNGSAFLPTAFFTNSAASASTQTFKLYYWAQAPDLASDSSTFLIASDVQDLLEFYTTADLLEQAEEFTKASEYWSKYFEGLVDYSTRVKRNNKSDLLLRV